MFRLLFVSPRIAPNTGNAIRTCAATGCELHLVEPLGFDLSEPKLRRAGLDYHDLASVTVHASLAHAWEALSPARVFAFTAQATTLFTNVGYHAGDVLMFGPNPPAWTRPPWLIRTSPGRCAFRCWRAGAR
ncbi:tRNA/rRNA methylase SpoU [Mycobacterium tuberculosis]|nr:tRNA/rRNA methylase SpoU [Mycobacterium tuberculosis]